MLAHRYIQLLLVRQVSSDLVHVLAYMSMFYVWGESPSACCDGLFSNAVEVVTGPTRRRCVSASNAAAGPYAQTYTAGSPDSATTAGGSSSSAPSPISTYAVARAAAATPLQGLQSPLLPPDLNLAAPVTYITSRLLEVASWRGRSCGWHITCIIIQLPVYAACSCAYGVTCCTQSMSGC